jgi:UDP-glucuronate decarboxylase
MKPNVNILITGGAGNVGGALARKLASNPNNYVVIIDDLSTGNLLNLPALNYNNWQFIKADVNNMKDVSAIMLSVKFNYVFHYAAVVGVQRTLKNPLTVLNDIEGIKNILDLSKNTGVQRVFFSSSSEVYGESIEFPQNENTTPLNSRLTYAIVKNIGEAFFKTYHKEFNLDYTIFRFFNTYGPNQTVDFVIPKFIKAALNNTNISIYGDGSQTRTFCYIDDNIDTTLKILNEEIYINDTINVGNDIEYTVKELAETIISYLGSKSKIIFLPPLEEGDMSRRKPDNSKMKKILGKPLISLEEGIKKIMDSMDNNFNTISRGYIHE